MGREYALTLASEGASVVVNDLGGARDGTGAGSAMADEVVNEIKDAGGRAVANYDSVAESEGAENIIKTALDEFGKVDGVVSNAGILRDGTFHKMEFANWDAVLKVHLYGGYNVIRAAWPHFREQSFGRVVVATSTSGLFGNFGQANYGAAKLGLVGLINTLAQEGAKYNIKANAVAPIAATRMTAGHPAAGGVREADAGVRGAGGGLPVHRGGARHRVGVHRRRRQGAAHRAVPERRRHVHRRLPSVDDVAAKWGEITDLSAAQQATFSSAESVKALVAQELSGPSGLVYTDVDDAAGGDDAVIVDVGAAGVSFPDLLLLRGEYQLRARAAVHPRHGGRRGGAFGALRVRSSHRANGFRRCRCSAAGPNRWRCRRPIVMPTPDGSTTPRPSRCSATTTRCTSRWRAAARCGPARRCWCSARRAASVPPPFRSQRRWAPR